MAHDISSKFCFQTGQLFILIIIIIFYFMQLEHF